MLDLEVETVYRVKGHVDSYPTKEGARYAALMEARSTAESNISLDTVNLNAFQRKREQLLLLKREAEHMEELRDLWTIREQPGNFNMLCSKSCDAEVCVPQYLSMDDNDGLSLLRACVIKYCSGIVPKLDELIEQHGKLIEKEKAWIVEIDAEMKKED